MKLLVINGTYRKGKTIDALVEKAIEGAQQNADVSVETIRLTEKSIKYCTNCMACRKDEASEDYAKCPIKDDMREIYPMVNEADAFIFATPINCGTVTAVMKTFLERTAWVFGRPGPGIIDGCPQPRSGRRKRAIILLSTAIVPPLFRRFCDDATSLITSNCKCCFGARVIGSLYAGAVETRGLERYLDKALKLGKRLRS